MLVKNINIVKSIFFYYYLPLQYNKKLSFAFQVLQESCQFWEPKRFYYGEKGSHKAPGVKNCHFLEHITYNLGSKYRLS